MNDPHEERHDHGRGATEKLWDRTRKTFKTATFEATRYKRVVQKKIDLAALHKKISGTHSDLGKLIDDLREAGETDLMGNGEVQEIFRRLDGFKQAAAVIEEEIETIRDEAPPNGETEESSEGEPAGETPPTEEEEKRD